MSQDTLLSAKHKSLPTQPHLLKFPPLPASSAVDSDVDLCSAHETESKHNDTQLIILYLEDRFSNSVIQLSHQLRPSLWILRRRSSFRIEYVADSGGSILCVLSASTDIIVFHDP